MRTHIRPGNRDCRAPLPVKNTTGGLGKMLDVLGGLGTIQLRQVLVYQNQFRRQSQE